MRVAVTKDPSGILEGSLRIPDEPLAGIPQRFCCFFVTGFRRVIQKSFKDPPKIPENPTKILQGSLGTATRSQEDPFEDLCGIFEILSASFKDPWRFSGILRHFQRSLQRSLVILQDFSKIIPDPRGINWIFGDLFKILIKSVGFWDLFKDSRGSLGDQWNF